MSSATRGRNKIPNLLIETMLDIALKEWNCVCDWLTEGQQAILLRKGGIHEEQGPGVFQMEHDRFLLFPSWAHQNPKLLKPEFAAGVEAMDEPDAVTIQAWAEPAFIKVVPDRPWLDAIGDLHCWNDAYLDMRWQYKPERPLYLLVLRVYTLAESVEILNRRSYAGCRSWVPLEPGDAMNEELIRESTPAMNETVLASVVDRLSSM